MMNRNIKLVDDYGVKLHSDPFGITLYNNDIHSIYLTQSAVIALRRVLMENVVLETVIVANWEEND